MIEVWIRESKPLDNWRSRIGIVVFIVTGLVVLLTAGIANSSLFKKNQWGGPWHAPYSNLRKVDFDPSGNAVIADEFRNALIRLDATGEISSIDYLPSPSLCRECQVFDLKFASDGGYFVAYVGYDEDGSPINEFIAAFSSGGELTGEWKVTPTDGSTAAEVLVEPSGTILVLGRSVVDRYDTDGTPISTWNHGTGRQALTHMALDGAGGIWVTGTDLVSVEKPFAATKSILRIGPDGKVISDWTTSAKVIKIHRGQAGWAASGVEGFTGVATRPGGGVWTSGASDDNLINGYSASGVPDSAKVNEAEWVAPSQSGSLNGVDPQGDFWVIGRGGASEFGSDGALKARIPTSSLPKYRPGDRGEGLFRLAEDIEIGPGNRVYVSDQTNGRSQRFSSSGEFEALWDGPMAEYGETRQQMIPGAAGSVRMLAPGYRRVYSYSPDGSVARVTEIELPEGEIKDGIADGDGLRVLASVRRATTVSRVDSSGNYIDSWTTMKTRDPHFLLEKPSGNLLIGTRHKVIEFTSAGVPVRSLLIIHPKCSTSSRFIKDMNVDRRGNLFLLAGGEGDTRIIKYSPDGTERWAESIPGKADYGSVAVDSRGDFFLTGSRKVFRFELEGAGAKPPGACVGMKIEGIRFGRGRRTARIEVSSPSYGQLTLRGDKIRTVARHFSYAGTTTMPIRLKSKFLKVGSGSSKVAVKVRLILKRNLYRRQQLTRRIVLTRH